MWMERLRVMERDASQNVGVGADWEDSAEGRGKLRIAGAAGAGDLWVCPRAVHRVEVKGEVKTVFHMASSPLACRVAFAHPAGRGV